MMAEAQEKDQTYLEEKRIGKLNRLRFHLLRTNQPSSKKLVQSFSAIMILSAAHLFFIFLVEMAAASKNRMFESENLTTFFYLCNEVEPVWVFALVDH